MSELCTTKPHFSTVIISVIFLFFSFILSHPLYFSYFIFFSPYLLKLFSFLSPLFITTLLAALLTAVLNNNFDFSTQKSNVSHLLLAYSSILEKLRCKKDHEIEEFHRFDDLAIYEIFFGSSVIDEAKDIEYEEAKDNEFEEAKDNEYEAKDNESENEDRSECDKLEEIEVSVGEKSENNCGGGEMVEEKRMENFLKILDEFEKMSSNGGQVKQKVAPLSGAKHDKVVEKKSQSSLKIGSEVKSNVKTSFINGEKACNSLVKSHSQRINNNSEMNGSSGDFDCDFGGYGSMRKEKEWKRTLACKLFEERHNVDGGEGMDSLWEAYELDSSKSKAKNVDTSKNKKNKNKSKSKSKSKSEIELNEEYEEHEEDDEIVGQLCCLQALKLSAGKMNLGMGRPNLVKITKAIKGIGWLHHVSKKVHNNGDKDRY
ncbi:hypothetical protein BUALT_Bualt02G0003800 [Buddleja alternifolia]|uniref:Transmembrane protein n=1 Tax=Buddleja alternifolia TaxID=168488 RepID=A0AAV6XWY0_9LAMI|nr:hypothetical protein BUALT_Bualt02G0003800 [Buddleja alternifolia]